MQAKVCDLQRTSSEWIVDAVITIAGSLSSLRMDPTPARSSNSGHHVVVQQVTSVERAAREATLAEAHLFWFRFCSVMLRPEVIVWIESSWFGIGSEDGRHFSIMARVVVQGKLVVLLVLVQVLVVCHIVARPTVQEVEFDVLVFTGHDVPVLGSSWRLVAAERRRTTRWKTENRFVGRQSAEIMRAVTQS